MKRIEFDRHRQAWDVTSPDLPPRLLGVVVDRGRHAVSGRYKFEPKRDASAIPAIAAARYWLVKESVRRHYGAEL